MEQAKGTKEAKIEQGEVVGLSNGRDYLCFANASGDGKDYIYLMSTDEPMEIRFAEQKVLENGKLDIRMIGKQEEKMRALELFKRQYEEKKRR